MASQYHRRFRRRRVREMTPEVREFLRLYLDGASVRQLGERFGLHPLEVFRVKANLRHEHRISPSLTPR
jgi:hypothetical protein